MHYICKYYAIFILVCILFFGCKKEPVVNVDIHRFEKEFYNSEKNDLKKVIKKYPYLFPKNFAMDVWESYLIDSIRISTYKKTLDIFDEIPKIEEQISMTFGLIHSFFPEFKNPKVVTLNSQDQYESRVIYTDSILLISLDQYLGFDYYPEIPEYIARNMTKKYISNDVCEKISQKFISRPKDRSLIAEMIYHGKIIYLTNLFSPYNEDYIKFRSTKKKVNWAYDNERYIWGYFIENNFLFNTGNELKSRFITFSPFSKFNLDIDKFSPGSIGKWLGYRIVSSYMENNNVDIDQLIEDDFYKIFSKSKYKPKK
tara:strand:+ start:668 stop:1606 length:939 start_codon:yes stop_codon:yes gene_type:complete